MYDEKKRNFPEDMEMSEFMRTKRSMWGGFTAALMALVLVMATLSGCTATETSHPPADTRKTKFDAWVVNLTVPGAPLNTAYIGGDAEMVGYLQGTGTHVAFFLPPGLGWPYLYGMEITEDEETGGWVIEYKETCGDVNFSKACVHEDWWFYQKIDQMGHARMTFWVWAWTGYYDIMARPVIITGSGTPGHKMEFEQKIRVYFSRDLYGYYD